MADIENIDRLLESWPQRDRSVGHALLFTTLHSDSLGWTREEPKLFTEALNLAVAKKLLKPLAKTFYQLTPEGGEWLKGNKAVEGCD